MASVTPSDGSYSPQLAEEYAKKWERTIKNMREQYEEQAQREKELYLSEVDQIKKETYDRYGRIEGTGVEQRLHEVADSYQKEIQHLKEQQEESEKYLGKSNVKILEEKEKTLGKWIANQNAEHLSNEKTLIESFKQNQKQLENKLQQEQEHLKYSLEKQAQQASFDQDQSLKTQASSYQKTIQQNKTMNDEKLSTMQKELQSRKTSSDVSLISPAAEAGVRKNVIQEYEKKLDTEVERNRNQTNKVHRNFQDKFFNLALERDDREKDLRREQASQLQQERSEFLHKLQDVEFLKENQLKVQENTHMRETEDFTRSFASTLKQQRRLYEELLKIQKNDAEAKVHAIRQEKDQQQEIASRTFSVRQNELIREYEKKLADQKADFENAMTDTKTETQKKLREMEKRDRQAQEDLIRTYEQKLAQIEVQHQERERLLNENYHNEVEKMKRTHAELIKKKS